MSIGLSAQIENQKLPRLNGHTFIPLGSLGSPFTNSYFQSNLGFASSSSVEFPLLDIGGQTIYGEIGGLLMATLGFSYQHQIKDWLAFNINPNMSTRIGTDVTTLLTQGINTVAGIDMQWVIRLVKNEKQVLSGTINISSYNGTFINIYGFVEDVINNIPNPSISSSIPVVNSGIGLKYAHGINDLFGFHLTGDFNYGEGFARGDAGINYKFGGSFEVNISERTKTPLGFVVWFTRSTQPENVFNSTDATHFAGLKIAYMGTSDFSLGLEFAYVAIPVAAIDKRMSLLGVLITTRYFFN